MGKTEHLVCCFCHKSLSSNILYKHIVNQHTEQLLQFNESATLDNRNIKKLCPSLYPRFRRECVRFDLPKFQDFFYCFGCQKGVKKYAFAEKHTTCMGDHGKKMEEMWLTWKHLLGGKEAEAPPSEPPKTDQQPVVAPPVAETITDPFESKEVMALVYAMTTRFISLRKLNDELQRELNPDLEEDEEESFDDQLDSFVGALFRKKNLNKLYTFEGLQDAYWETMNRDPNKKKFSSDFIRLPNKPEPVKKKPEAKPEPKQNIVMEEKIDRAPPPPSYSLSGFASFTAPKPSVPAMPTIIQHTRR